MATKIKKYDVDEKFIRDGHAQACASWKKKIAKEFPELFRGFAIGDIIQFGTVPNEDFKVGIITGIGPSKKDSKLMWIDPELELRERGADACWTFSDNTYGMWKKADEEHAQRLLIEIAKTKGYTKDNIDEAIGHRDTVHDIEQWTYLEKEHTLYTARKNDGGHEVFSKGKWLEVDARIGITEAEAARRFFDAHEDEFKLK